MGSSGAPEELRFDFGVEKEPETPGPGRRQRRRLPPATAADGALALQRRVDEVSAVAHSQAPPGRRRQALGMAEQPGGPSGEWEAEGGAVLQQAARREGALPAVEADGEPQAGASELEGLEELAGEEPDEALTIAAFYERVRAALWQAFPDEVWVTGEIRGLKESRGHRYLELADEGAEPTGRGAGQQLEVVCWAREWPRVAAALAEAGVSLEVGRVVRVRGRVSVWEGGSKLRFTLTAIDVEALLGGIAAARHRLLQVLAAEDLLEENGRLPLSLVPLRIGVVTSPGSEAHRDFVGRLDRSGFAFEVRVEPSLVQGPEAPFQLAAALRRLAAFAPDLAVMVRGGGARGDLAAFDSEEVARAIATAPFPVWTGIGHTGDRSVADEVAQRACITPTACGEALVAQVCAYRDAVDDKLATLAGLARARLDGAAHLLAGRRASIGRGARHQLDRRADALGASRSAAGRAVGTVLAREQAAIQAHRRAAATGALRLLERESREHHRCSQVLRAYDPARLLERGWSLTRDASGRVVRRLDQLQVGDQLHTRLLDGEVTSLVEALLPPSEGRAEDGRSGPPAERAPEGSGKP